MVKMVIYFKRKAGMTVEAFQEHWRTRHAEIIARLPGIRRYVQNATLASAYRKGEPAFDAVAESCFDDTQAMKALARLPEYAEVLADEPNFIDAASMGSIITDEQVVKDSPAPADAVKTIDLVRRREGMAIDEFFRYWLEVHGPLCRAEPAMRRYVQNATLASAYRKGEPAFDAIAESWFDDTQAMKALARLPVYAEVLADEPNFIDAASMGSIITDEHVVKDSPAPADAVKTIDLVRRREGMAIDEFFRYWLEGHGPLCRAEPAMRRYVQSHTRRSIYDSGRTPAYDGAAMAWFDGMPALREAAATPGFAGLRADVEKFIDRARSPSLLTSERVVLG